jgi:Zn-dependent protease with chaperone function
LSSYTNPRLPQDEINVSEKRPLSDFLVLVAGLFAVVCACALVLMLFAQAIASWVPFSVERSIADRFFPQAVDEAGPQAALQRLADSLVGPQGLPPGMVIRVQYRPLPVPNASATLGGHITIYRGLLDQVDSENALALVLAHEIAHVRHRDPVAALGRGAALVVVLSAVSASAGSKAAEFLLGNAGTLTALTFSRAQEARADADALAAVAARYGHVAGADAFFARMQARALTKAADGVPTFMRTHPATDDRITRLAMLAADRGWPAAGPLTPLPAELAALRSPPAASAP